MEEITPEWLKARLDEQWGSRQRLADHLGLSHDKVSRMVNGTRRPQATEVPKILEFFGISVASVPQELADIWSELEATERQTILSLAKVLREQRGTGSPDSGGTE